MRLHATAASWALLAFTAPRGLEAKGLRRKLLATKDCTIMAVEALGLEGNEDPEMIIECELSPEDADGISGISAPIDASPEQLRDLRKMIETGEIHAGEDLLDIEGDEIDEVEKKVKIEPTSNIKAKVMKMPKDEKKAKSNKDRRRRLVDTTGDLRMLLVKVTDSTGKTYPDSPATMSDEVFGTGNDPVNLKSGLEECSFNKLTVVPGLVIQNDATPDMEVATGVIEVTIDVPLDGSSNGAIRNAVTTKVQEKLGYNLPGPYDYVLYSLEGCYGGDCGWAAYAYINSWNSVYQNVYYRRPGVLMHELGHNFGLAHSGGLNNATYTDHTCTMGNPHYSDDGFQCFNPAKNFQLNWYDDNGAKITEDPRISNYCKELTLVGIGEYDIRGNSPVTVRLETGTGADYFVGFNRATGPNRLNDEGDNQVNIIQVDSGNGQSYSQSYLRALLSQGQSYQISNFGGTGKTVTITVISIDITTTPGTAVVTISDGFVCGSPTPPPTPAPTQEPCPSGQERYQVTVQIDNYGSETAYTLTNTCSDEVILAATTSDFPLSNTEYPSAEVCADRFLWRWSVLQLWYWMVHCYS
jgi:hypothetical protein